MMNSRAAIFLAAGQGSRLRPHTNHLPKCLLPMRAHKSPTKTVLDCILPLAISASIEREIVVVGGFAAEALLTHIAKNYAHLNITFVNNEKYAEDVNILSTDLGVDALQHPERGYTIIETDVLLSPTAWKMLQSAELSEESFWVTHGRYSPHLTGGIVHAPKEDRKINKIAYVPNYDAAYENWHKMVGILSVAPNQVCADQKYRKEAILETIKQYYMNPWITHSPELPCFTLDLGAEFFKSFNTVAEYETSINEYAALFL